MVGRGSRLSQQRNGLCTCDAPGGSERIASFGVRLYETEGRAGRVQLRCFRTPASARRTDFEHRPAGNLPIEDDRLIIDIAAFEWVEVEAYW
jgi:alpha-mannosidase